jgi:hypothetical protein
LDAEESLLRIERGQVDHDELAALVVVLLTRRKVREKPAANGSRWSRRSGANAPAGSWLRTGVDRELPFG